MTWSEADTGARKLAAEFGDETSPTFWAAYGAVFAAMSRERVRSEANLRATATIAVRFAKRTAGPVKSEIKNESAVPHGVAPAVSIPPPPRTPKL